MKLKTGDRVSALRATGGSGADIVGAKGTVLKVHSYGGILVKFDNWKYYPDHNGEWECSDLDLEVTEEIKTTTWDKPFTSKDMQGFIKECKTGTIRPPFNFKAVSEILEKHPKAFPNIREEGLQLNARKANLKEEQTMKTHIKTQLKQHGIYKLYLPDFDSLGENAPCPLEAIQSTLKTLDIPFNKAICLDESNTQNAVHFLADNKSRASWFRYPDVRIYGENAGKSGYLLIRSKERSVIWSINQVLRYNTVALEEEEDLP